MPKPLHQEDPKFPINKLPSPPSRQIDLKKAYRVLIKAYLRSKNIPMPGDKPEREVVRRRDL